MVYLPESLAIRLFRCYFGAGPRDGEPSGRYQSGEEVGVAPKVEMRLADYPVGWQPRGVAKRRETT